MNNIKKKPFYLIDPYCFKKCGDSNGLKIFYNKAFSVGGGNKRKKTQVFTFEHEGCFCYVASTRFSGGVYDYCSAHSKQLALIPSKLIKILKVNMSESHYKVLMLEDNKNLLRQILRLCSYGGIN